MADEISGKMSCGAFFTTTQVLVSQRSLLSEMMPSVLLKCVDNFPLLLMDDSYRTWCRIPMESSKKFCTRHLSRAMSRVSATKREREQGSVIKEY